MIKQFTFVNRRPDVSAVAFPLSLHEVFGQRAGAPLPARPLLAALCTALPAEDPRPRHDAVSLEWFDDDAHLERFEEWRSVGAPTEGSAGGVDGSWLSTVVVTTEVVQRGADWLHERWRKGGPKFKHMAMARRADHLTPAEFSRRVAGARGHDQPERRGGRPRHSRRRAGTGVRPGPSGAPTRG